LKIPESTFTSRVLNNGKETGLDRPRGGFDAPVWKVVPGRTRTTQILGKRSLPGEGGKRTDCKRKKGVEHQREDPCLKQVKKSLPKRLSGKETRKSEGKDFFSLGVPKEKESRVLEPKKKNQKHHFYYGEREVFAKRKRPLISL